MSDGRSARKIVREEPNPHHRLDEVIKEIYMASETGDYEQMADAVLWRMERDPDLMAGNQRRVMRRGALAMLYDVRGTEVSFIKTGNRNNRKVHPRRAAQPRFTVEQTIEAARAVRPAVIRNWFVSIGPDVAGRLIHFTKKQLLDYAADCRRKAVGLLKNAEFCEALSRRLDDEQTVIEVWSEEEIVSLFDSVSEAVQRQSEEAA